VTRLKRKEQRNGIFGNQHAIAQRCSPVLTLDRETVTRLVRRDTYISDLEPDKLGQPFRPAIFEIRDSNRPLSFFNIATIRLQHRQVRRHAVGF